MHYQRYFWMESHGQEFTVLRKDHQGDLSWVGLMVLIWPYTSLTLA